MLSGRKINVIWSSLTRRRHCHPDDGVNRNPSKTWPPLESNIPGQIVKGEKVSACPRLSRRRRHNSMAYKCKRDSCARFWSLDQSCLKICPGTEMPNQVDRSCRRSDYLLVYVRFAHSCPRDKAPQSNQVEHQRSVLGREPDLAVGCQKKSFRMRRKIRGHLACQFGTTRIGTISRREGKAVSNRSAKVSVSFLLAFAQWKTCLSKAILSLLRSERGGLSRAKIFVALDIPFTCPCAVNQKDFL